ncbi:MAG: DUF4827 domain-containing protein [Muribaculaceae bacterium]
MKLLYRLSLLALSVLSIYIVSCKDSKSYSKLLDQEKKAVNLYLSDQRVEPEIPADSVFETGPNAPFYKMDTDGNVYMQVIDRGDMNARAKQDQLIYFRYMRANLYQYEPGVKLEWGGNSDNMGYPSTSFRFGNAYLQSSYRWGQGIQIPLYYLGIGCEVNLVIKSQYGLPEEQANVIPFLYNIRYFKSQI